MKPILFFWLTCYISTHFYSYTYSQQLSTDTLFWRIDGYVSAFKDSSIGVRRSAAEALGEMGKEGARFAPQVAELLNSDDSFVRSSAAEALGEMGKEGARFAPRVAELLNSENDDVRSSAAEALGKMGKEGARFAPRVAELLNSDDSFVRRYAAEALGEMGKEGARFAPQIAELLNSENFGVRRYAAEALGEMGKEAARFAPRVAELLNSDDSFVRLSAAEALGKMGKEGARFAPQVAELLNSENFGVRRSAAYALGEMGKEAARFAPRVAELLNSENLGVRRSAVEALGKMGKEGASVAPQVAELLNSENLGVRRYAAEVLGEMGKEGASVAPQVAELLNSENDDVRSSAAEALGEMGKEGARFAPQIAELLNSDNDFVRRSAAYALARMRVKLDTKTIICILNAIQSDYDVLYSELRFLAHYSSGGQSFVHWLGKPNGLPNDDFEIDGDDAIGILNIFSIAWDNIDSLSNLKEDIAKATHDIININKRGFDWTDNVALLKKHRDYLIDNNVDLYLKDIEETIVELENPSWWKDYWHFALLHPTFWLVFIFVYPKSKQVQAIFFWNKWVTVFASGIYVAALLTWVPFLRNILLSPFNEAFLSDAYLQGNDNYFKKFSLKEDKKEISLKDFKTHTKSLNKILIEGDSGLGKSMLLRHLAKESNRISVFLSAEKCDAGVVSAIQNKTHGLAQKSSYLRDLIYVGAIDIYIDGLNEVSKDIKSEIRIFCENYTNCKVFLSTQPIIWKPAPSSLKTYKLLPLNDEQILQFLVSKEASITENAKLKGNAFKEACKNYIDKIFISEPNEDSIRKILSNPMELTLVAEMIAEGKKPNLFNLQKQQYDIMNKGYKEVNLIDFPIETFSQKAFEIRLNPKKNRFTSDERDELYCMEKYKMVVPKMVIPKDAEDIQGKEIKSYIFRHEKISDYFIAQYFIKNGHHERFKHFNDTKFIGTYLLLATILPLDEAVILKEHLIEYAAINKDHQISDSVVLIVNQRIIAEILYIYMEYCMII